MRVVVFISMLVCESTIALRECSRGEKNAVSRVWISFSLGSRRRTQGRMRGDWNVDQVILAKKSECTGDFNVQVMSRGDVF